MVAQKVFHKGDSRITMSCLMLTDQEEVDAEEC